LIGITVRHGSEQRFGMDRNSCPDSFGITVRDHRNAHTGHGIYRRTLKKTGDEEKAVKAAGVFYRIFGASFLFLPALLLIVALKRIP